MPTPKIFRGSRIAALNQEIDELRSQVIGLTMENGKLREELAGRWIRFLDHEGNASGDPMCPACVRAQVENHMGPNAPATHLDPIEVCMSCGKEVGAHD